MKCQHEPVITPIGDGSQYELVKCSKCGVEKRRKVVKAETGTEEAASE